MWKTFSVLLSRPAESATDEAISLAVHSVQNLSEIGRVDFENSWKFFHTVILQGKYLRKMQKKSIFRTL